MPLATDPFLVISSVGGPAVLTNACSLVILSTTNRFGRAIDRSRHLATALTEGRAGVFAALYSEEIGKVGRRVALIGRALASFYIAMAMFGLATLLALVAAVLGELAGGAALGPVLGAAAGVGAAGFVAFVGGGLALIWESRLAMAALARESAASVALAARAAGRDPPR